MQIGLRFSLTGLLALVFASQAFADDRFTPPSFSIRSISYAGSGCPAGSVAENVSPDLKAFTLLFDRYIAQSGPGIPLIERRKNCQLNISFDYPNGYSFALLQLDTRGYASLDPGASGKQQVRFYFQGSSETGSLNTILTGPYDGDYQVTDVVPASGQVFAPCGAQRSLNINTSIIADGGPRRGQALMTTDSVDGELVSQIYAVVWRRC